MARKFVVENGVITNCIEAPEGFQVEGATLVAADGNEADIGWLWDGEFFSPPAPLPLPLTPDWDSFNATLLADARLNQVCGAALQAGAVVAVTGLPAALTQVINGDLTAFGFVFNAVCQLGGATTEDREGWALIAEANNLPAEFAQVIRG